MKLINNMLGQIATVAIAEALVFGKKAGLDPPLLLANVTQQVYQMARAAGLNKEDVKRGCAMGRKTAALGLRLGAGLM